MISLDLGIPPRCADEPMQAEAPRPPVRTPLIGPGCPGSSAVDARGPQDTRRVSGPPVLHHPTEGQ